MLLRAHIACVCVDREGAVWAAGPDMGGDGREVDGGLSRDGVRESWARAGRGWRTDGVDGWAGARERG